MTDKSDVWLTVHLNLVWIRNPLDVTYVLSFISPLLVAPCKGEINDNT